MEKFDVEGLRVYLRCQECKHTFDDPPKCIDGMASAFAVVEKIICPGCGNEAMRMFYIQLYGTSVENASNPPIVKGAPTK